jgi:hypothetical protein
VTPDRRTNTESQPRRVRRGIRWWPGVLVLMLVSLGLIAAVTTDEGSAAAASLTKNQKFEPLLVLGTIEDWNNYRQFPFAGWSMLPNDRRHETDTVTMVPNPDPAGLDAEEVLKFSIQNTQGELSKVEGIVMFTNLDTEVIEWEAWYYIPEGLQVDSSGLGWEQMIIMQFEPDASEFLRGPMWAINLFDGNGEWDGLGIAVLRYPNFDVADTYVARDVSVPMGRWFRLRARVSYGETTSIRLWLDGRALYLQNGEDEEPLRLPVLEHSRSAALVDLYTTGLTLDGEPGGHIYVGPVTLATGK